MSAGRDRGDPGQPAVGGARVAGEQHRLGQRLGPALDGLALAQRAGEQFVLRLGQLGGGDRLVAEAGDLAPQRRFAGLGALALREDRIDGEIAAARCLMSTKELAWAAIRSR